MRSISATSNMKNMNNFSSSQFQGATLVGADFSGSNLSNANFASSVASIYVQDDPACISDRTYTCPAHYTNSARFTEANLTGAQAIGARFSRVDFSRAIMRNVNFQYAAMNQCPFTGADLSYANFSDASLIDSYLGDATTVGINLDRARR